MGFTATQSIDEVIAKMDTVIEDCIAQSSRLGYFAVLYREVTIGVKVAIQQGFFDDGARMENLDVVFANRYLQALYQHQNNEKPTVSWLSTFECTQLNNVTVLQHLLLGMNAHINLDLGIAAAAISTPRNIDQLYNDFQKINIVIANVYQALLPRLKKVSWAVVMLGDIRPAFTKQVINFSIEKARSQAWANALLMAEAGENYNLGIIEATDTIIARVANSIKSPGFLLAAALKAVRFFESDDVQQNLLKLKG